MTKIKKAISIIAFVSTIIFTALGLAMMFSGANQSSIDKIAYALLGSVATACVWKWWE
jgi:uncharacterized BrkB/YihY/UPF0761 family membrane protein